MPGEGARAQRTAKGDQIEAVEVHIVQVQVRTHAIVEQRELNSELSQGALDRGLQVASLRRGRG
jgi:hypothetical protein